MALKSTIKLIIFFTIIGLLPSAYLYAFPEQPGWVAMTAYIVSGGAAVAIAGLVLWRLVRFVVGEFDKIMADDNKEKRRAKEAEQQHQVVLSARAKQGIVEPDDLAKRTGEAKDARTQALGKIKELAGLADAFFIQAQTLAAMIESLRNWQQQVLNGQLDAEAIGYIQTQDPTLGAVLNTPSAWTTQIRDSLVEALGREIGSIDAAVQTYRQRGIALVKQVQQLRATIRAADFHIMDAAVLKVDQQITDRLLEAFALLDEIGTASESHSLATGGNFKWGMFKWRLPGELLQPGSKGDKNGAQKALEVSGDTLNLSGLAANLQASQLRPAENRREPAPINAGSGETSDREWIIAADLE